MKTTLSKIALTLLLSTFSYFSHAEDFVYDNLAPSDQTLLDVAKKWKIDRDGLDKPCLQGLDKCQGIVDAWSTSMFLDDEGKKYFRQFVDVPPHIYGPKVFEEFVKRYNNWSARVKQGNICYLVAKWELRPVNPSYYSMASEDIGMPATNNGNFKDRTLVYQLRTNEYVKIAKNGKFLELIPSSFITQSIYSKFKKLDTVREIETRASLKICGQFTTYYEGERANMNTPMQETVYVFEVNKAIEIVEPKSMKTLETIPDAWYGYK